MEWEDIPRDEQETLLNIDYGEKEIIVYTNRKSVAKRLKSKVGEPTKMDVSYGKICGVTYKRKLYDKDLSKFFSKILLIGSFLNNKE